jgi:hypothetical protein
MAHSVLQNTVFGNLRTLVMSCTADAASGIIETGLGNVVAYSWGPISMATGAATIKKNLGSAATAIPGRINYNSMATGDSFFLIVYGN